MAQRLVASWLVCAALVLLSDANTARADLPLERLSLPAGFEIEVFAEVPGARSLAVAADGRRPGPQER